MKIELQRIANKKKAGNGGYCIGHLYIDGVYYCDTIEDIDRGLSDGMTKAQIASIKIPSKTAIPTGTYRVRMDRYSPKFGAKAYYKAFCKGLVPYLANVPGYEGILMHRGTNEESSAGCIILGYNKIVGQVVDSQKAFEKVYAKLKTASDIRITITRKYSV